QQLIEADKQLSKLVATSPTAKQSEQQIKTDITDIEKFMARQNGFVAGTAIEYFPSYICTGQENQTLASGFNIGQRFHSAEAIRVSDGRCQHLGHLNKADGRWRLFIFGSDQNPTDTASDSAQLIHFLAKSESSPVIKYTPEGTDIDSVIDVYGVFQQRDLAIEEIPGFLWPAKGKYGLNDYEKVFHADQDNDIYALRGIDRSRGCMVIVRPDQHIANILPLNAQTELSAFFDEFMLVPTY
ncbi:3-hydroxybenzoate 4-monooxygenase, partial [Pseudomonadales bacterium]|nr:3-hydroxybenzoate 4-monooxygenase [Pseudomonadales bacterium]